MKGPSNFVFESEIDVSHIIEKNNLNGGKNDKFKKYFKWGIS